MQRTLTTICKSNFENENGKIYKIARSDFERKNFVFVKPRPFCGYRRNNGYFQSLSKMKKIKIILETNSKYGQVLSSILI